MLVVVVGGVAAGPLDPGSGLTGTLHYRLKTLVMFIEGRRDGGAKYRRGAVYKCNIRQGVEDSRNETIYLETPRCPKY